MPSNATPNPEVEHLESCVLCGSNSGSFYEPYGRRSGYSIVECRTCGLIFVNPRDSEDRVASQYVQDQTSPIQYYARSARVDRVVFGHWLDRIEQFIPKGTLLDIGCNVGTFMETAAARGWKVEGVEANPKASAVCREKNLTVHNALFGPEFLQSFDRKYDLVCMNDTIEHFPDPSQALQWAQSVMAPGGHLSLTTPNIDNLLGRLFQIKPKEHLFYFSDETLRRAFEKAGYEVQYLIAAGRRRDIGSLPLGSSIHPGWLAVARGLSAMGLDGIVSVAMEKIFKSELFALARKSQVRTS